MSFMYDKKVYGCIIVSFYNYTHFPILNEDIWKFWYVHNLISPDYIAFTLSILLSSFQRDYIQKLNRIMLDWEKKLHT